MQCRYSVSTSWRIHLPMLTLPRSFERGSFVFKGKRTLSNLEGCPMDNQMSRRGFMAMFMAIMPSIFAFVCLTGCRKWMPWKKKRSRGHPVAPDSAIAITESHGYPVGKDPRSFSNASGVLVTDVGGNDVSHFRVDGQLVMGTSADRSLPDGWQTLDWQSPSGSMVTPTIRR